MQLLLALRRSDAAVAAAAGGGGGGGGRWRAGATLLAVHARLWTLGPRTSSSTCSATPPPAPTSLRVGDLIEFRRRRSLNLGVVLRLPFSGGPRVPLGKQVQEDGDDDDVHGEVLTLLSNGHTYAHPVRRVAFCLPHWAFAPELSHSATAPSAARGTVATTQHLGLAEAGLPSNLLLRIRQFEQEAEELLYGLEQTPERSIARMYHHFLGKGGNNGTLTSEEAARWMYGKEDKASSPPTPVQVYACHQLLLGDGLYFEPDLNQKVWQSMTFHLRQPEQVASLEFAVAQIQAKGAARSVQRAGIKHLSGRAAPKDPTPATSGPAASYAELDAFLDKCRALQADARASLQDDASHAFTSADHAFLDLLKRAVSENYFNRLTFQQLATRGILVPLGLTVADAPFLLKQLGAWTPWENPVLFREEMTRHLLMPESSADPLPGLLEAEVREQEAALLAEKSPGATLPAAPQVQGHLNRRIVAPRAVESATHREERHDACDAFRRDFSDLPVYVIDAEGAHELDDGVSIEPTPEGTWIHVHVADPTSLLRPDDTLSRIAQLRATSLYFPDRHYPMLPSGLTERFFNLGTSHRALTFSARLDAAGNIADYRVQPSYVRNVRTISYEDVNRVLRWGQVYGMAGEGLVSPQAEVWTATNLAAKQRALAAASGMGATPALPAEDVRNLRLLQALVMRHMERRVNQDAFMAEMMEGAVELSPYPLPLTPWRPKAPLRAGHASLLVPRATLSPHDSAVYSPSRITVAESMIIACRVAAKYCSDRGVPVQYRGQRHLLDPGEFLDSGPVRARAYADIQAKLDRTSGVLPYRENLRYTELFHAGEIATRPLDHYSLGIRGAPAAGEVAGPSACVGYSRVTSPIRRFNDLLAHWQIKAALVAEHTGQPVQYPFTEHDVLRIGEATRRVEKMAGVASKKGTRFWILQWLLERELRAMAGEEVAPLDATLALEHSRTVYFLDDGGYPRSASSLQAARRTVGSGLCYTAVISHLQPREASVMVELVELGGVRALLNEPTLAKRQHLCATARIGEVVEVVVSMVHPTQGVLIVRRREGWGA